MNLQNHIDFLEVFLTECDPVDIEGTSVQELVNLANVDLDWGQKMFTQDEMLVALGILIGRRFWKSDRECLGVLRSGSYLCLTTIIPKE